MANLLLLCWTESQGSSKHDQYEWPTSVCGVDGEVNEETLMRSNEMSGGEMVEKTKSYLKKNGVAYINGLV